jgi:proteasome lid subunit RPN8/RPN11
MSENEKSDNVDELIGHMSRKELVKLIQEVVKSKNFEDVATKNITPLSESKIEAIEKKLLSDVADETIIKNYSIVVTTNAILGFVRHALIYANPKIPKEKWVEVIGLLGGRLDAEKKVLFIEDIAAMGYGNSIHAEINDYNNVTKAQTDLLKRNMFVCGWYHSHPSYNLFLSNEDIATQTRWQKLWPPSIALVVDPELIDGTKYGFKIFRVDLKTKKYIDLPFSIKGAFDAANLFDVLKFFDSKVDQKYNIYEYDVSKSG